MKQQNSCDYHRATALLALLLSFAATVHGADSPENLHNDTESSRFATTREETVVSPADEEQEENKAATILLTFSLLLAFAVMGVNMRKTSFQRAENLSSFRRGTYEGVSLVELPPGGACHTNYTIGEDSLAQEEGEKIPDQKAPEESL